MKCLTVGILLTMEIGPFSLRESGVQQDIQFLIVGEDICVTEPPFAIPFSKLGEGCLALAFDQRGSLVDHRLDSLCLFRRWWSLLGTGRTCDRHPGYFDGSQNVGEHDSLLLRSSALEERIILGESSLLRFLAFLYPTLDVAPPGTGAPA